MKENHINTLKTARYFTLGEISCRTKTIWLLFHGYGQLANEFLEAFSDFESQDKIFIAPEGLSRFYAKGFTGNVGASWMTKEDRETEIRDYIIFVNSLFKTVTAGFNIPCISVNLLGFSQGASTAFRVFAENKFKVDKIILWAGSPPRDIDYKKVKIMSVSTAIKIFMGDNDKLVDPQISDTEIKLLNDENIKFEIINYKGGHNLSKELAKQYLYEELK